VDEASHPHVDIRTSPERAAEFLEKLAHDREFREQLERGGDSAVKALASYEIYISPDLVEEPVELPFGEELEEVLRQIELGEFAGEPAIKFWPWPIFWTMIKFRKFISFKS
jgi:hypothetical protein